MSATTSTRGWAVSVRGAGPPLVLVHGFTGSGAAWDEHASALGASRRLVVPDLPGHGDTVVGTADEATVERSAEELAALMTALGAAPADVLGYSLGARIALRLAIAHPGAVRRLVLESASAGIEAAPQRAARAAADEELARRIERDGVEAFVAEWERHPILATHEAMPDARRARVRAMRRANTAAGLAASLRGAGQGRMEALFDRLSSVSAPTLVIAGALDDTGRSRAERVAAGIPGARLEIVEGAGHTPHDEQPETFRRLVLDFLEEPSA